MVEIKHTPTNDDPNSYTVIGDSINEIVEFCMPRIRQKSKAFYKEHLITDLNNKGKSLIDRHAGNGNFYKIELLERDDLSVTDNLTFNE